MHLTSLPLVCDPGWWAFRQSCYLVIVEDITALSDAIARCDAVNARLTDMVDSKEHVFLTGSFLLAFPYIYITFNNKTIRLKLNTLACPREVSRQCGDQYVTTSLTL